MSNRVIDSFDVYANSCGLSTTATLRGFDTAVQYWDDIIVAEAQSNTGHSSSIARAADDAFDAGTAVFAPTGNFGPGAGTVRSPALAHKALGVGASGYWAPTVVEPQFTIGRGPTSGRPRMRRLRCAFE